MTVSLRELARQSVRGAMVEDDTARYRRERITQPPPPLDDPSLDSDEPPPRAA